MLARGKERLRLPDVRALRRSVLSTVPVQLRGSIERSRPVVEVDESIAQVVRCGDAQEIEQRSDRPAWVAWVALMMPACDSPRASSSACRSGKSLMLYVRMAEPRSVAI